MKKFLLLFVAFVTTISIIAQDEWKNHLTISGGYPTAIGLFTSNYANDVIINRALGLEGKINIEEAVNNGAFSLAYHRQTSSWFQIGVKLNWQNTKFALYTTDNPELEIAMGGKHQLLGRSSTNIISAMISAQFIWFNRPLVRLYSGIDLGAGCAIWTRSDMYKKPILNPLLNEDLEKLKDIQQKFPDGTEYHVMPFANITLIGLHVGKRIYGLAEINAGMDAIAKLGLGVSF